MSTARSAFTATLLESGTVLAAGGDNNNSIRLASAELYNPSTGKWTPTGSMNYARFGQTATVLNSGKVLVAAGNLTPIAELYDPSSGKFSVTATQPTDIQDSAAVLLSDGAVLIPGGYNAAGQEGLAWLNTAVLYH